MRFYRGHSTTRAVAGLIFLTFGPLSAVAERPSTPTTRPRPAAVASPTAAATPDQAVASFLALAKSGDHRAAALMTHAFDAQFLRYVTWTASGPAQVEKAQRQFKGLRRYITGAFTATKRTFWSRVQVSWRGVTVSGDRATVSLWANGYEGGAFSAVQLLLRQQNSRWVIAGIDPGSHWENFLPDWAATSPGDTWGRLLCITPSAKQLASGPMCIDLDTGEQHVAPRGGVTEAWAARTGVDLWLSNPAGDDAPSLGINSCELIECPVSAPWLITPGVARALLADKKPSQGAFSGRFLVKTREGTVGLLIAEGRLPSVRFMPLTNAAQADVPEQLRRDDTARLFLLLSISPIGDDRLLTAIAEPGLPRLDGFWRPAMAYQSIHGSGTKALAVTYARERLIDGRRSATAYGVYLSKQSGRWLAIDVKVLKDAAIRKATGEFLAKAHKRRPRSD